MRGRRGKHAEVASRAVASSIEGGIGSAYRSKTHKILADALAMDEVNGSANKPNKK
jgi:hypothetical protein